MIAPLFAAGYLLSSFTGAALTYSGHQVLRCNPTTKTQLDKLHDLSENSDWDFWMEPKRIGGPVDIFVTPSNKAEVMSTMHSLGVECKMMIEDVQHLIEKEKKVSSKASGSYFDSYHTWEEVHAWTDALAEEFPQYAKTSTIGKTYEGRDIKIITMSTDPSANKPTLWFDAGIHAREWIAVPTVSYIADTLLRGYGTSAGSNSTYLLDNYDVIVCPIINVDGYDYTWNEDRMWRKTRSINAGNKCVGVDPNRNWDFHWGEAGTSPVSCSDSYQGPSPASEVEVQAVQSYICAHPTIKGYINFHSYSQLWMSNWGYTDQLPPDYKDQNGLSAAATAAIKSVHGITYEYGPIATTIYPASGSSADYTYGVCGVKYSYGVELRDTGEFGFLLPAEEIIPSGEEIFAGVVAMGQYIQAHP